VGNDLRHDPIMAVLAGKLVTRRKNCAPVAGKSTLNRLELGKPVPTPTPKSGLGPSSRLRGLCRITQKLQHRYRTRASTDSQVVRLEMEKTVPSEHSGKLPSERE
jgi:hypothetical protein